jgi:hypothetical protein
MIVFDLKCAGGHVFEAWFADSTAYDDQRERGLIACPLCGDTGVGKAVMAPRIPSKGNRRTEAALGEFLSDADKKALIGKLAGVQSKMLESSEWVGRDFDAKARAMDAGEEPRTTIHGEVSRHEAKALIEDGIGVTPLLLPVVPPEKSN